MAVAENTAYRGTKILIGKMTDLNTSTMVASKALDISAFVTAFTASTKPQKETVELMANAGQQAADITGSIKFSGNLDLNMATGLLLPLVSGVVGSGTQVALTASDWASETVTAVGNIVKHSGGKYLVAQAVYGDMKTGTTEPTITTEEDYTNLTIDGADASNGVIWKLRDALYNTPSMNSGFCTDKFFIIERAGEGCGSSNVFDTIALNVELTAFNIEKADGSLSQKQSIPWLSTSTKRSSDADYEDITVTSEIKPIEQIYKAEDITVRVDGEKYGTVHNFKLNYTRQVTQKDSVEPGEQITVVNSPTLTGDITNELVPEEYAIVQASATKVVTVTFDRGDGEKATATYPAVTFDEPDVQVNGNEPRLLMIMLKPTGNATTAMSTFDITSATVWA
jgi:hypothetical protein